MLRRSACTGYRYTGKWSRYSQDILASYHNKYLDGIEYYSPVQIYSDRTLDVRDNILVAKPLFEPDYKNHNKPHYTAHYPDSRSPSPCCIHA